jgi:hypothetical protein
MEKLYSFKNQYCSITMIKALFLTQLAKIVFGKVFIYNFSVLCKTYFFVNKYLLPYAIKSSNSCHEALNHFQFIVGDQMNENKFKSIICYDTQDSWKYHI